MAVTTKGMDMPIYEYQCRSCQHTFETIQGINEPVLTTCPVCAEEQLRKLVSKAAFRLKGSGWYETDFKSKDKKNVAKSDEKSAESTTSGASESKDTPKPASSDSSSTKSSTDSTSASS